MKKNGVRTSRGLPITQIRRRARPDWCPPTRIPRPLDLWFSRLVSQEKWVDTQEPDEWLSKLRRVAASHECGLICDRLRDWRESGWTTDYRHRGPTILAGGAGDPRFRCTVILHELGHHILWKRNQHPKDDVEGEEAAWRVAQKLAEEHRLPLLAKLRSLALHTYRHGRLLDRQSGSKRRSRRKRRPRSWRLEESRRSGKVSLGLGFRSRGKRGRRHAKRFIKRSTVRRERRRPLPSDG